MHMNISDIQNSIMKTKHLIRVLSCSVIQLLLVHYPHTYEIHTDIVFFTYM